jgi:hypothetical protein
MRLRRTLIGLALLAGLAAPQAAQAAVLAPLAPCYRSVNEASRENVAVRASGFTPGANVDVSIDGVHVQRVEVLPDGTVSGSVNAPYQGFGQRPFTLTVTEHDTPGNTASATSLVTALDMRLKPRRTAPHRQVRFLGRGFTDGVEVFGHYLRRGKLRKTVSLGAPQGPCGRVDIRRRQIPVRNPHVGRWILQVDNQAAYTPDPPGVSVDVPITVRRVVRRRGTPAQRARFPCGCSPRGRNPRGHF